MLNILVTGANGQLGKCIKDVVNNLKLLTGNVNNYFFTSHNELDITNYEDLEFFVIDNKIDVIINCAAYTNVSKAEKEDSELAYRINSLGVKNLADVCVSFKVFLINIGTDYIYDGETNIPISEDPAVYRAINVYGDSKLDGIFKLNHTFNFPKVTEPNYITIVTSWLYSEYEGNFVSKMYNRLLEGNREVVNDQTGSPTYAPDLARFIVKICEDNCFDRIKNGVQNFYRLIHFSNEGTATWYDLAKGIEEYGKTKGTVLPCNSGHFDDIVKRPKYSVLSIDLAKQIFPEFNFRYWRESLKECIEKIRSNENKNKRDA